jgi:acetyltransferase-like isoleucine patch superfamily enzyme
VLGYSVPRHLRFIVAGLGLLPSSRLKNRMLSAIPGIRIDPHARVGPVLIFNVQEIEIAAGASIGFGNVFRDMGQIRLEESATMGSWNWVSSANMFAPYEVEQGEGCLVLGPSTAISSRHYFDCTGGISLGRLTTVGGGRSTWLTHRIELSRSLQISQGTRVGDRCFVASGVQVGPGVHIPDNSVIAMGAVVVRSWPDRGRLYGGVPARDLGPAKNEGYINRSRGYVDRGTES